MIRGQLPFVPWFARSFVRLTSRSKENDNGGKKVLTRGRRGKIIGRAKKKNLIANRGLKSRVHRDTLLEECVGRIVFLSFNLQHIFNISERACYYILMLWCGLTFWMANRLDQRRLNVAKWDSRGGVPSWAPSLVLKSSWTSWSPVQMHFQQQWVE
jgi:hypothetical protein